MNRYKTIQGYYTLTDKNDITLLFKTLQDLKHYLITKYY